MNKIQTINTETITTEILMLKQQISQNIIEIGKRLIVVKDGLPHGEWGKYLEEKVEFSQQTAQRFMKVATEFPNPSTLRNLSQSKVFALLSLPQEDRESFVKENPVNEMTTRELQQAIKEKQDLEAKLKDSLEFNIKTHELANLREEERDEALKTLEAAKKTAIEKSEETKALEIALSREKENLKKEKENSKDEIAKLQTFIGEAKVSGNDEEVARLQASLKEIQGDLDTSALKIDELEEQLKTQPVDVTETIIEKIPEEIEKELQELREKAKKSDNNSVIKFKIYYDEIQKTFTEQLKLLAEIKETDPETYEKCKKAILNLTSKMAERL